MQRTVKEWAGGPANKNTLQKSGSFNAIRDSTNCWGDSSPFAFSVISVQSCQCSSYRIFRIALRVFQPSPMINQLSLGHNQYMTSNWQKTTEGGVAALVSNRPEKLKIDSAECPYLSSSFEGQDKSICSAAHLVYIPSAFELKEYCREERHRVCPFYRSRRIAEDLTPCQS